MKVDVLQVENAKFKSRWRWWSDWVDIAIFEYNSTPFLLQMQVNRLNRKRFISTRITGAFVYRQATVSAVGGLMPMKRGENES